MPKLPPIIFGNTSGHGASNISADGSTFTSFIEPAMHISRTWKYFGMTVKESSIWNTVNNISSALGNNQFAFIYAAIPYSATIPNGSYSLAYLQSWIERTLVDNGLDATLITLTGDDATQKVIVTLKPDTQIDMTGVNAPSGLLGFNSLVYPAVPDAVNTTIISGPNVADFAAIDYFLITCDQVRTGMSYPHIRTPNIIHRHLISSDPGYQSIFIPYNPIELDLSYMIGSDITQLSFTLTDQLKRVVDTNAEDYTFLVDFVYEE